MKRHLLIISFLASLITLSAQPYGNEWITPGQTYYKIKVTQDGIHRIPASALPSDFSNKQTNLFAMFHNGEPVRLFTPSTTFGTNDYIEFYGEKNKGYIDSLLYRSSSEQINPEYSLFNDTSIYYLTIGLAPNNYRLQMQVYDTALHRPKENFFIHQSTLSLSGTYYEGQYYSAGNTELYKSIYDPGEGYANSQFFGGTAQSFTVPTPSVYTPAGSAVLRTYFANNSKVNNYNHRVLIKLNNNPVHDQLVPVDGFQLNRIEKTISTTQLLSGNNTVSFSDIGTLSGSQRQNIVGFIQIEYPRQYHFGGANRFLFKVPADPVNKKYLEINGFDSQNTQPLLYDLTDGKIYRSVLPAGTSPLLFQILPSTTERHLFLRSDASSTLTLVTSVTPITFPTYQQATYYIISNAKLRNDGSGNDPVQEYRNYRNQRYRAEVADIDVLYDQFAYGIRKSPLAIRNFIRYADTILNTRHVFIIGKGRENFKIRNNPTADAQCLVPTFGYPGSDNLLAATRVSDTMTVGIGRLAAENTAQVIDYLDKVKKYEQEQGYNLIDQSIPPKDWQKKILHFSGGTDLSQQDRYRRFVHNYSLIAADTSWGADTTSYSKRSSDPIDQSLAQIIKNRINQGVSWITFFGHSATGAFDFSIDEPENYNNSPKFPIILSNGCFSGFVHDVTPGFSERFVLAPDKAAIAFMATSSLSLETGLNTFSTSMYENVCRKNYYQPLGKAFYQAYNDVVNCCSTSESALGVAYEMTLHGDPGILPNQYPKPDYAIDSTSVFFTPFTITPGVDSFEVSIIVTNLGKAINDSILVTLKRRVFDASNPTVPIDYDYQVKIAAPYYKQTVSFTLPVKISNLGYGQNLFYPYVDAAYEIDEMAEGNNGLTVPVSIYIQNDDIIPIYPYEFAIVPDSFVTLKASTVNPFAPFRGYRFEVDTTELFNSSVRKDTVVYQSGGVVHWAIRLPHLDDLDSTVFYWRVAKDTTSNWQWHYSSFLYLNKEYPGWNQSHYFQWKKDSYLTMSLDTDRVFRFPPNVNNIQVTTGWSTAEGGNLDASNLSWTLNNSKMYTYRMGGCDNFHNGITIAVIDPVTGPWKSINVAQPLNNSGDTYGNIHCANKQDDQFGFDFITEGPDAQLYASFVSYLLSSVPCENYIAVYSTNRPNYSQWPQALVLALQSIGFDEAPLFQSGSLTGPFIYFTQKCNSIYDSLVTSPTGDYSSSITGSFDFILDWYRGQLTSPKIGPAVEWGSAHWVRDPLETPTFDRDTMDIIGVTNAGVESVLLSTTAENNFINNIDADAYPYLRLRLRTRDDSTRTPTQLKYWRILYKKPPEAAINPAAWFKLSDSAMSLGQTLHLEVGLENVTDVPMDSMLTKYTVRDASLSNAVSYIRYDSLRALDTMHLLFDLPLNSQGYAGLNKIIVEANPDNDQLEQYHFNNFAEINFTGSGDNINPLLDVTFDNQHIMNGDIVSAKPNILITLKDENKFLALDDQSLIDVYLKYPGETVPRLINYDNNILKFYPADASNLARSNKATVEFKPVLTTDGKYELIIKDRDRSDNNSSTDQKIEHNIFYDYKIAFEVINKPMITNVLNYPNPFTTATKFVFTVTGSEVPDYLKIQIMTIKGTVVKEITKAELGDLHVGRNITQYTWDGRDEYGDVLANGVYFYYVSARLDDKRMDHMSQSYDKYFKKGFGKLVIIR